MHWSLLDFVSSRALLLAVILIALLFLVAAVSFRDGLTLSRAFAWARSDRWRPFNARASVRCWLAMPFLGFVGVALASCASLQTSEGQGLAAAQDAVAAAVQGVHQAYVAGVITKAQVQQADVLADQADAASIAARTAYAAGDSTTAAGAIAQLTTLAAEIVALEKPQ